MLTIVDYGGANIASIQFAFERLGVIAQLSRDAEIIKSSSHVILPGVGTASVAMNHLKKYDLIEVVRSLTQPVLGICLGMQLLFNRSAEGEVDCLQLIPGNIKEFTASDEVRVPHMGWNTIESITASVLMHAIPNNSYVYFVHSYTAPVTKYTTATSSHGELFSAAVQYKNFFGTQFHPERSGEIGAKILKNFLEVT